MKSFFTQKKILITGHTGFQGSWLTYLLARWGADVAGIALEPHTSPSLFDTLGLRNNKKVHTFIYDIREYGGVKKIFEQEKPEIVFHLAAQALVRESYRNPLLTHATNIMGTAHVMQAIAEDDSIQAAVIVTTDKVYKEKKDGDASAQMYVEDDALGGYDPYGASKAAADIVTSSYARFSSTHIAVARSGNVIGGGDWSQDRLIPDVIFSVYKNATPVILRYPTAVRPWQHVFSALHGYLLLAQMLYERKVHASGAWNIGPEPSDFLSVEDLTKRFIARLGRGVYRIEKDISKPESEYLTLDSSKIKKELGWRPFFNIEEVLDATAEWYKAFYEKRGTIGDISDSQLDRFFTKIAY